MIIKSIFRLILRGLLWLLGAYWLGFLGYTVKNLIAGGWTAVLAWYEHISGPVFKWDWRIFLVRQLAILGVTLILYFFDRRMARGRVAQP